VRREAVGELVAEGTTRRQIGDVIGVDAATVTVARLRREVGDKWAALPAPGPLGEARADRGGC
jgi:hypothetical protein